MNPMNRLLIVVLALASSFALSFTAADARADVQVEGVELYSYQLPGTLDLGGAQLQRGAGGTTVLSNTVGTSPPGQMRRADRPA